MENTSKIQTICEILAAAILRLAGARIPAIVKEAKLCRKALAITRQESFLYATESTTI